MGNLSILCTIFIYKSFGSFCDIPSNEFGGDDPVPLATLLPFTVTAMTLSHDDSTIDIVLDIIIIIIIIIITARL